MDPDAELDPSAIGYCGIASAHPELDASRGAQFAALGVDVRAATLPGGYASVTGTSYAAPAVTARFALLLRAPDTAKAKMALSELSEAGVPLNATKDAPKYLDASMATELSGVVGAR